MWHDLLATTARGTRSWRLAAHPPRVAQPIEPGRQDQLVTSGAGHRFGPARFRGERTGPKPTDPRETGSKRRLITDATSIPLAAILTGANPHAVIDFLLLVHALPPVSGQRGRPRRRPDRVQGSRAYQSKPQRDANVQLGIEPGLERGGVERGGTYTRSSVE